MGGPGGMGVLHQRGRGPGPCLPNSVEDSSETDEQQRDPECLAVPRASREERDRDEVGRAAAALRKPRELMTPS